MMVNKRSLLVFIFGVSSGFFAMYLVLFLTGLRVTRPAGRQSSQSFLPVSPHSTGENDHFSGPDQEQRWDDFQENNHHAHEEYSVAKDLEKHVRVLCWVMTSPSNLQSKARHVKATWGRRCNKLLFMSSQQEDTLPAVGLPVEEGREHLWRKTKEAFKYVYAHHMDDADWFLKADDDTYVILENLRLLLRDYDPMRLLYLGRRFKPYIKQGYMSGGAGYVLSKEAVRRLVEQGLSDRSHCRQDDGGAEDLELGMCLQHVGVTIIDSRDSNGRETFHPFLPEYHLIPGMVPQDTWYWEYNYYPATAGPGCCSDFAITFHYVPPNMMYVFEYFIYHLKPFGIESRIVLPSAKYRPEVNNQKQPDRSSQAAKRDTQYSQLSKLSGLSSSAGHATTKVLATGVEQPQSKHKFHFKDYGTRKRVKLLPKQV